MCEPHYVNLFFIVSLLHSPGVWLFDIFWQFDTDFNLNHFNPSQGYFIQYKLVLITIF